MPKIALSRIKQIIREELQNLDEGQDHDSASKIMSSATKLLNAIESFKDDVSERAKGELGTNLDEVENILNRIVSSPMQYVDVAKPQAQKVTLKPTKTDV